MRNISDVDTQPVEPLSQRFQAYGIVMVFGVMRIDSENNEVAQVESSRGLGFGDTPSYLGQFGFDLRIKILWETVSHDQGVDIDTRRAGFAQDFLDMAARRKICRLPGIEPGRNQEIFIQHQVSGIVDLDILRQAAILGHNIISVAAPGHFADYPALLAIEDLDYSTLTVFSGAGILDSGPDLLAMNGASHVAGRDKYLAALIVGHDKSVAGSADSKFALYKILLGLDRHSTASQSRQLARRHGIFDHLAKDRIVSGIDTHDSG